MILVKYMIKKSNQNHAPEGGITISGKHYSPGEFLPTNGPAKKPLHGLKKWSDPEYNRPDLRKVEDKYKLPAPTMLHSAKTIEDAVQQVAKVLDIGEDVNTRIVNTPTGDVIISYHKLYHTVEKRSDERERYANYILPTLQDPFEVWEVEYEHGIKRDRYIGLFHGSRDLMVSVSIEPDGTIMWNFMQESHQGMNRQRIGNLKYYKK